MKYKFRAWDKVHKEMIEWEQLKQELTGDWFEDEDLVFMQDTGMADKNNREIYTGDRVRFPDIGEEGYEYREAYDLMNEATIVINNGRIEVDDILFDDCGVQYYMSSEHHSDFIDELMCDIEVIGNIYQNPELLEGAN